MAYLYVKNESDAIDIVYETIYKAYISIKKLKETDYFSTWLMRILINTALDFFKKNKRITPAEKLDRFGNILYLKKIFYPLFIIYHWSVFYQ
jgi:RNA polymerase sigma-70 factor, ECF subfamily